MKISFKNSENTDPERMHGMKLDYAPSKRKAPKWRLYLIILVVFSPFLVLAYRFSSGLFFVHATGFINLEFYDITSTQEGHIKLINARVGQQVKENDVLMELTNPELEAKYQKIHLKIQDFENNITKGGMVLDNDPLISKRQAARENLEFREAHYKKMLFLFEHKAATAAEVNIARIDLLKAQFQQGEILNQIAMSKVNKEQPNYQWKREELQLESESLAKQIEALKIVSPGPGTVLNIYKNVNDAVSRGTSVMMINLDLQPENHVVTTYLDPKYIQYAVVGKKTIVVFPDGSKTKANISSIEGLTRKMPLNLARNMQIENKVYLVLKLTLPTSCSNQYAISGLPVTVYFNSILTCLTENCPWKKLKKYLTNMWAYTEKDTLLSHKKNTNVINSK